MLKIGDRVKVFFPPGEQTVFADLTKFDGKVTVIKEDRYYKKDHSTTFHTYILVGCKNDHGIPYEFCAEWLIPLDEEVMI